MQKILILLSLFLTIISCKEESESSDLIALKLEDVNGFGSFPIPSKHLLWVPLSERKTLKNTEVETTGVPETWTESNVVPILFDSDQFFYQHYKLGNFSEEEFNQIKASQDIDLKRRKLSDVPINCFVHIAMGKNENGELVYLIDTNHDNDFSDEEIQQPTPNAFDFDHKKLKSVTAEISTNGGIQEKEIKILVLSNDNGRLMYNFPHFAETTYLDNTILVSNGFMDLTYKNSSIALDKEDTEVVKENGFIEIGNDLYKNLGADINSNELQLLKMPKDTVLYIPKVGFKAKPFSAKKLETNDSLTLDDFKDKLVYLEFWGTWCAPCIQEMPNLKEAYAGTNRKDVEFLGVAVYDTKEKLKAAIEKYEINWPQVLDTDANKFKESYNVTGYPTSFLIDKNGEIIAKNLRGEKLLDTLNYYIKRAK